jgi:hypothetical protein
MKLYTAKVRIGGSRDHEVIKHDLTGAEMKLLEAIHVSAHGHPVEDEVITPVDEPVRSEPADASAVIG